MIKKEQIIRHNKYMFTTRLADYQKRPEIKQIKF